MTTEIREHLYRLLPAVYRLRDAGQGQPLRALMAILERELDAIRDDIDTTWDNWFIETCEEWLVPYIGAGLGVTGIRSLDVPGFSQRAFVANTLAYRRRKGTAAVLEQLAQDLLGHRTRAVEYFVRIVANVHTNHVHAPHARPTLNGTVDLRTSRYLQKISTPFDRYGHTVDVRRIDSLRGRYNVPNLGLHVWRVHSQEITRSTARAIAGEQGWYRFDPHGADVGLFNVPETETTITTLAQEHNVPHGLSRLDLWAETHGVIPAQYLGADPAFVVRTIVGGVVSPPWPLEMCDLSEVGGSLPSYRPTAGVVGVDPELGRIVFALADMPLDPQDLEVMVDYAYGAIATLGAGPVDRTQAFLQQLGQEVPTWRRYVSRNPDLISDLGAVATLEDAILAWNAHVASAGENEVGLIVLLGGRSAPNQAPITPESRTYAAPSTVIQVTGGARLYIVAGSVLVGTDAEGAPTETCVPSRVRTPVIGDIEVVGSAAGGEGRPGGLFLNGISLEGKLTVLAGDLRALDVAHCSLLPLHGGIEVLSAPGNTNAALSVTLVRSISGPVTSVSPLTALHVHDTIVYAQGSALAIDLEGAAISIDSASIVGNIEAGVLEASNAILDGDVYVEQHQQGCVRFSYAPLTGQTPRRYRCQPDLALEGVALESARQRIIARIRPNWASLELVAANFGALAPQSPNELLTGSEDGCEMGAFRHLQYARREANLRRALNQYLRFGMTAGVFVES